MDSDKENISVKFKMEGVKQPSKSILKDNTLPLSNDKRRVSFAPEVTLHKFDFVPSNGSNKRRKTIGFTNEANLGRVSSSADSALELLSDSSDDEDVDFSKLESNADQIINGMDILNHNANNEEFLDADEEVTMELTGQIKVAGPVDASVVKMAPAEEHVAVADTTENNDHILKTPNVIQGDYLKNTTGTASVEVDLERERFDAPRLSSSEEDSDEKIISNMDEKMPNEEIPNEEKPNEEKPNEEKPNEEKPNEEKPNEEKPNEENNEDFYEDAMTMELTSHYSKSNIIPMELEEVTMELTNAFPQKIVKLNENIKVPVSEVSEETKENTQASDILNQSSETNIADNKPNSKEENNVANKNLVEELSVIVEKNESSGDVPLYGKEADSTHDFEKSMDITNVVQNPPQKDDNEEEEEEITMELTQLSRIPSTSNPRILSKNETATMLPDETEMTNKIHETNKMTTTNKNLDDANYSREMELTQEGNLPVIDNIKSQPMQLTQNGSPEETRKNDINNIDFSNKNMSSDISNSNNGLVTTTSIIPLADMSNIADENESNSFELGYEDYAPVSLNDFMYDIGIKFYDDLDINIDTLNRLSISFVNESFDIRLEDYIKAIPKSQLLALYEFGCEELSKNIQEGKLVFSEFSKTIENNNPQLFKEYYSSNEEERFDLNMKLQLIKDYTRQQSKKTWYDWRAQLTNNLLTELDIKYEVLKNDKDKLIENLNLITVCLSEVKSLHDRTKHRLGNLIKLELNLKSLSTNEMLDLKRDLLEIGNKFHKTKNDLISKQKDLQLLNITIAETIELKNKLQSELLETEKLFEKNKRFESNDIKLLNQKFKILQGLSGLSYLKSEGMIFFFKFDSIIDVKINFKSDNIMFSLDESKVKTSKFHNQSLIQKFISKMLDNICANSVESFKLFKSHWNKIKQLDSDIFKISLKFPVQLLESDNTNLLKFTIKYFNSLKMFKVLLYCEINIDHGKDFKIYGKLKAYKTSTNLETIRTLLANDIVPNNLINSTSLKNFFII